VANITTTRFEATDESFSFAVVDAGGEPRELDVAAEDGGLRITVFHGTEHALVPVDDAHARELARWLVERVGLPPGWLFDAGQLYNRLEDR
jgi:hypothetical protein